MKLAFFKKIKVCTIPQTIQQWDKTASKPFMYTVDRDTFASVFSQFLLENEN